MKSTLKSLMSVAAAALALTSCSTDATEEVILKGEPKTLEVNASIEQTRTVMAANHIDLEWSAGDEILLYIGEEATKADAKTITPASGGKITNVTCNNGDKVFANYSIDNAKYSNGVKQAEINIVAEQTQTAANVFAGENLPMVAKGVIENGKVDLEFKPVGCVLVFNVYGPADKVANEKIQSIKFETTVGCIGYTNCDLTAETLGYEAREGKTSATVKLTAPASVGTEKPADTKIGSGNQVYLVVAPVNYEAATFTVTTNVDTYTFKTSSGIDCSQNTARVVNLNLAKSSEMQPAIEVPTVEQLSSNAADNLSIEGITFKNIADADKATATVDVYGDEALTQKLEGADAWLTITSNGVLADGTLNYSVAANETSEARTAYIVIECAGAQAVIPITQVAKGASTEKYFVKVTETPADWTGEYLIVYEAGNVAFKGSLSPKPDATKNTIDVKITAQGILSNDTTNAESVKISKIEGSDGYILQASSGLYIYSPSDANQLKYTTTYNTAAKHPNTISIVGGVAIIDSYGSIMRFNKADDQMRFRYYKSGSYSAQQPIQLYKLQ